MPGLWNPPTGGLSFPLNSTTCSITKTVDAATLKLWLRFKFKPAFCSERLPVPGCWVKVQFVYHSLLVNQTLETLFTRGTSFLLSTLLTIASFNSFLFTMAMLLMWYFFPSIYTLCVCAQSLMRAPPFVTPWTTALQAPLSMGFSRQGNWSGLPFPPPGDLPRDGTCVSCISSIGR